MTPPRHILHLDMDAFYASVEMQDDPSLRGKPVIVGGSGYRGVVCAASYEARAFGIHSAMPLLQARKLCPQGIYLPVRMYRYQEVSRQIMAIFATITPLVEALSLDEAFLDVSGSLRLFGTARDIAVQVKKEIHDRTGLTASAGVASSKLVAKIASDLRKPDGLTVVEAGKEREFLAGLAIGKLWGVGKQTEDSLRCMGVKTIGDLTLLPEPLLVQRFGKLGRHLWLTCRGIDHRQVQPEEEARSIGNEETYERDIRDRNRLARELLALAEQVGRRLRRHHLAGRTVTLKVKYHDFRQVTRSITLKEPTSDGAMLHRQAMQLLERTEAGTVPVRLLGISVSNLLAAGQTGQLRLFAERSECGSDRRELNRALDAIAGKYGSAAIVPAALLEEEGKEEGEDQ
ncbi:MAG: DNA polymerase IV [Thermodesulfobacteriota bacterium]